ncbi:hypothetical protein B0T26DRAFT_797808 [Lasiosphaeria miniovina]|uniref:Uncharacterized protein n=1 Tax=Lasiosphaeria miniovina TaxID=1954250 RepID=A0AA40BGK5_9PEZI|nr:uncharacterized protein B0T26DRAFT_797808 [Lasiosphaeria miniovina]KAK0733846.1 hypothetical protein B0T26DRAFT_797808 [Lasiosphaeria miniovina]
MALVAFRRSPFSGVSSFLALHVAVLLCKRPVDYFEILERTCSSKNSDKAGARSSLLLQDPSVLSSLILGRRREVFNGQRKEFPGRNFPSGTELLSDKKAMEAQHPGQNINLNLSAVWLGQACEDSNKDSRLAHGPGDDLRARCPWNAPSVKSGFDSSDDVGSVGCLFRSRPSTRNKRPVLLSGFDALLPPASQTAVVPIQHSNHIDREVPPKFVEYLPDFTLGMSSETSPELTHAQEDSCARKEPCSASEAKTKYESLALFAANGDSSSLRQQTVITAVSRRTSNLVCGANRVCGAHHGLGLWGMKQDSVLSKVSLLHSSACYITSSGICGEFHLCIEI